MRMPKFDFKALLLKGAGSAVGAFLGGYLISYIAKSDKIKPNSFLRKYSNEVVYLGGGAVLTFVSGYFKGLIADILQMAGFTMFGIGMASVVSRVMTKEDTSKTTPEKSGETGGVSGAGSALTSSHM